MGDATAGGLIGAFRAPHLRDLAEAAGLFAVFTTIALPFGLATGVFAFGISQLQTILVVALIAVLVPALGEELVFRVLLQGKPSFRRTPESSETGVMDPGFRRGDVVRIGLSLIAFVAWHPVQVWLGLPMAQPVFTDPVFLGIAALLGIVCTISWQRSGSVWPPVLIHWLTVVSWKAFLAG
ncbi:MULTISPECIES: CPBP family glutamic-type intramembrane protease [Hyphobacterium]|uniref:Type II CAAX prenyl endopeptidase Rce1 family protein n=1 Tax=Hyphobacterium vulgare TaxID=1736751 RepID=A0ABV6ZZP8_9PROT